jgi:soluble lytic murein transglycosylase-like protein
VNFSVWKNELSIDKKRIFDIDYNIELGLQILKRYYQESKGNIFRALHLYNNGYRYNNLSYVSKVKSQLGKFSLSAPMTVTDLENHNENVSDFSLTRQGQRSE